MSEIVAGKILDEEPLWSRGLAVVEMRILTDEDKVLSHLIFVDPDAPEEDLVRSYEEVKSILRSNGRTSSDLRQKKRLHGCEVFAEVDGGKVVEVA